MKILIATFTFPPNKDGVAEAASVMAEGFLERGWQVDIATNPVDSARGSLGWHGAKIHEFLIDGSGQRKNPYTGEIEDYREFLKRGEWDAIIFHAYLWPLLLILDCLQEIPSKKILVSHGYAALQWVRVPKFPWGLGTLASNAFKAMKMCRWIQHIDRVVYLSHKADFFGFLDHRIAKFVNYTGRRVIPNGVDPSRLGSDPAGFRERHGIPCKGFLFLCVANYSRRKDQGYAARAFRSARIPSSTLVFIGSEFNEHSERFKAEDANLPDSGKTGGIIWLENITRQETLNAYAACDAVVLSADHEAQPIVLLEAMREGKPWIARDAGCISEMPGGITVKSERQMGEAMRKFTANESLRAALGEEGKQAVNDRYNTASYKEAYVNLILETVR